MDKSKSIKIQTTIQYSNLPSHLVHEIYSFVFSKKRNENPKKPEEDIQQMITLICKHWRRSIFDWTSEIKVKQKTQISSIFGNMCHYKNVISFTYTGEWKNLDE